MMEIDPICEETTLWFEFLLKPELLEKQMTNQTKALEIMSEFLNIIPPEFGQQTNDINSPDSDSLSKIESLTNKFGRKQLAIKILELKIASCDFIHWNLDVIEKYLPISKQVQLLSDLCSITSGRMVNLPLSLVHEVPVSNDGSKSALSFALTIYHRWLLRAQVLKGSAVKIKPFQGVLTPQDQNICANSDDKFISGLESFTTTSIEFLNGILADSEPFKMPIFESFVPLEETSISRNDICNGQKFDKFVIINKTELKAQIYFDLCSYYIFTKKYDLAKEMATLCRTNYDKLQIELKEKSAEARFCTVSDENLKGYLLACGILQEGNPSLFQRFNDCPLNDLKTMEIILSEDNYKKEIPFIHRKAFEGDLDPSSNEFVKVLALNSIRYILDSSNIVTNDIPFLVLRNNVQRGLLLKYFIQYSNEIIPNMSLSEHNKIKGYLTNFLVRFPPIEMEVKDSKLFTRDEIDTLKRQKTIDSKIDLASIGLQQEWIIPSESKIQRIRVADFERKLVSSTTSKQVRKYLVELAKFNPQQSLWSINRNWYLPNDLRVVVLNLKRGFLQDFSYILLGKVNEMVMKKDFVSAYALISELKNEAKRAEWSSDPTVIKLGKLLEWEKTNIQILMRLDSAWPKKPPTLREQWTVKFIQLTKTITNDMPRLDIIENCLIMLLNLNDWENCVTFDAKRSPISELSVLFAKTMIDIQLDVKNKNSIPRKRDVWDFLLPIFNLSNQQQQTNMKRNQQNRRSSDSPARFLMGTMSISILKQFLDKMRDPFIISILLSMFAKMHNLIKDDTSMDLSIENLHLWPMSISNVNGYNIKTIAESLLQLLKLAIKIYPTNAVWIRLQGDLEYVNGNNEAAMKYYVQSLIISTEYCALPIQRPVIDENIIKKMIKCSSNLGCYLQAAVLCQFIEDVDYTLAFKLLQEKSSNFQDAMDSYYSLIWDTTLLEYIINLHAKKGEHKRRLQAISYIRQLELNANNSEEVKQKAASVRKSKFLRSLANQYL